MADKSMVEKSDEAAIKDKAPVAANNDAPIVIAEKKKESKAKLKEEVKKAKEVAKKLKKGVKFVAPVSLFVDFQEGTDKAVLESVKDRVFSYARDNATIKSAVRFNIIKVEHHSYFPDGYIFEIIEGGSGHSVLPLIIKSFKDKASKAISFDLSKGKFSVVEKSVGGLITYLFTSIPVALEKAKMESNSNIAPTLFVTNYLTFYVSMFLVFVGGVSVFLAMMFKYVIFQEERGFVDERHYTAAKSMPIDIILNSSSTDTERMTSVQFSKQHGWFLKKEIMNDDGSSSYVMDKIGKRGGLSRIKLDENGEPVATRIAKSYSKDGVKIKTSKKGE
jgi:hypothetical protein